MKLFTIILVLLATCLTCMAQADFRFCGFDDTKNEYLDYTVIQDITVYDRSSEDPCLMFYTEYRVSGINQKAFTFTTERFEAPIPRNKYDEFIESAKKLPTKELKDSGKSISSGWITLNGKQYQIIASPDTEVRKQWQSFLNDLLKKCAPVEKRKKSTQTIEGEVVEPVTITFTQLLENPAKFDGKRIRVTGFYHGEFERSSFASSAKDIINYDKALWLGEDSSFADPRKVSRTNDSILTIDGTFELGPGGHMGLWMGELSRVTEIKKAEQNDAGKPPTRVESK
jgi:hypothetical protein